MLECVRVCSSLESVKVCWIWIIRDKQKRPWGDWRWESECSAAREKKGKSQSDSSGSRVSHLVFFVFSLIHRLADCYSWVWLMDKTLYCRGLKSRRGSGIDVGSSSVVFFDTTILLCGYWTQTCDTNGLQLGFCNLARQRYRANLRAKELPSDWCSASLATWGPIRGRGGSQNRKPLQVTAVLSGVENITGKKRSLERRRRKRSCSCKSSAKTHTLIGWLATLFCYWFPSGKKKNPLVI